jgi:drug/metabolite transporter (DMT)-like permease
MHSPTASRRASFRAVTPLTDGHAGATAKPREGMVPLVLLAAVLGISVSGPLARLSGAHPLAIASWRLLFALAIVATFLLATGAWREYRTLSRRDLGIATGAGIFLAIHFWAWITSVGLTSVAASTVLVNMHPVVIVAGSALLFKERPARRQLVGIAIALAGAVILGVGGGGEATGASASQEASAGHARGNLLAVLGAIAVALYYLSGRSLRQRLTLWPYVGLVYGACFITLLAMAYAVGVPLAPQPPRELLIFTGITLGPMMLGHTGFNWALRYVPAYVVSLAVLAEPVGATILAALLPGIREVPDSWTLIGGAVILAGLALGALEERR